MVSVENRIMLLKTGDEVVSAPACYREHSGFESKYLVKIQNGRNKQKNGQRTLARQKIYKKQVLKTKAMVPKKHKLRRANLPA